ncbi:hypothetical protein [Polaribacter sp. Z022]|uniref:hypothetical protein n=1 Tax=Polaribacter sp. Z022 TaxID=2927125 RepID=UPI0020217CD8|nr:hypothetical protein [Polaribacter sp. Z022]MCL7752139.1 hypothetical protein [Polaribacter sp. Z022]
MKILRITLIVTLCLLSNLTTKGQNIQDNILKAIEIADNEYKVIVSNNMEFTKIEATYFWPLLDEYLNKKEKILNKEINMFLHDYTKMNEKEATVFLKNILKYDKQKIRLQKKYFRKIMKVISAKKFLRFNQIDHFIERARDFKLSYNHPLVKG